MSNKPLQLTPEAVAAMARARGVALAPERPAEIAAAVSGILGTVRAAGEALPFETEPASFLVAQQALKAKP